MSEPKKKKRGGHEEEGHADSERWMISYADMLTLLLALFIVMFAISKVDAAKFKEFSKGTAQYFGEATMALNGTTGILDGEPSPQQSSASVTPTKKPEDLAKEALDREIAREAARRAEMQNLAKVRDKIQKELTAKGLKDAVQFQLDERGLVVNIITDKVLFDTGKADLRSDGKKVLDIIAPSVQALPNRVTVEGHTDNVPITGTFASNWELSSTRATTVVRHMIGDGLSSDRVSAAGYADRRPLDTNRTAEGRARNRRVAIVVLPMIQQDSPASASRGNPAAAHAPSATPATTATVSPVTVAPHTGE